MCDFYCKKSGENSYAFSYEGLDDGDSVTINGESDLSKFIKFNSDGYVKSIKLDKESGSTYEYKVTINGRGPEGITAGSGYTKYADLSGDAYALSLYRHKEAKHTVCYNSKSPKIFKIIWNNKSISKVTDYISLTDLNKNWMKNLDGGLHFSELSIPASHDSGMSEFNNSIGWPNTKKYVLTQRYSIYDQIRCGCRFFDIRVDYKDKELTTYHISTILKVQTGAYGESFKNIFDKTIEFLNNNSSEFVVFKLSHIRTTGQYKVSEIANQLISFLENYSDYFYKVNEDVKTDTTYLNRVKVDDLRGKIMLLLDSNEFESLDSSYINPKEGRWGVSSTCEREKKDYQISIFDKYSNTVEYEKMRKDQISKFRNWMEKKNDELFLLSWTLTPNANEIIKTAVSSIEELSNIANSNIHNDFFKVFSKIKLPNLIYIDYIDEDICYDIIKFILGKS